MSQDAVFGLIRSMTPSEKRAFRLQSGRDKNYLAVFDAMDAMENYDHSVLKKKLEKKKLNLSYEKNYLGKQLLKTLRSIGTVEAPLPVINNLMIDIEILFMRQLFGQAMQKVEEAKAIAWKYDYYGMYMELLSLQKRILIMKPVEHIELAFDKLEEEQTEGLKRLTNLFVFVSINSRFHVLVYAKGSMMGDKKQQLEKLSTTGPMTSIDNALSPTAKMLYYSVKLGQHFVQGNYDKAAAANKELLRIYEEYPSLYEKNPQNYLTTLTNNVVLPLNSNDVAEAEKGIEKLRSLGRKPGFRMEPAISAQLFTNIMKMEIAIAAETGTIANRAKQAREALAGFEAHKKNMSVYNRLIVTYYSAIIAYFDGRVSEAQKILNTIINEEFKGMALDYYTCAKLLLALIHFEKGNYDLVKRLLKNSRETPSALSTFISRLLNNKKYEAHSGKERSAAYREMNKEIDAWLVEHEEDVAITFFPLREWIELKTQI